MKAVDLKKGCDDAEVVVIDVDDGKGEKRVEKGKGRGRVEDLLTLSFRKGHVRWNTESNDF